MGPRNADKSPPPTRYRKGFEADGETDHNTWYLPMLEADRETDYNTRYSSMLEGARNTDYNTQCPYMIGAAEKTDYNTPYPYMFEAARKTRYPEVSEAAGKTDYDTPRRTCVICKGGHEPFNTEVDYTELECSRRLGCPLCGLLAQGIEAFYLTPTGGGRSLLYLNDLITSRIEVSASCSPRSLSARVLPASAGIHPSIVLDFFTTDGMCSLGV